MGFAPGSLIVHRNTRHDSFGWVRVTRVVSDDERGLVVWLAPGTPVASEVAADGRGMRAMPFAEWITVPHAVKHHTWRGNGVLKFHPAGEDHSVWWFRDAAGRFMNWYVNLEERALRWQDATAAGIDVVDQDLDIVVAPDLSWVWKDEDEFTERLAFPDHYWVTDEAAVRAEGWRVVKRIEAAEFPFDGTWTDFEPDPAWGTPTELPAGWDRPAVVR
jgi:hypothetical protein